MIHSEQAPLAGQTVVALDGSQIVIEDWWDRLSGRSWKEAQGNPTCLIYTLGMISECRISNIPCDDEVFYGKFKGCGILIHALEIRAVIDPVSGNAIPVVEWLRAQE